jgi:hypothetical protein
VSQAQAPPALAFRHERVDDRPPCNRLGSCQVADLTGNGRPDLLVAGLGANPTLSVLGKTIIPREIGPVNEVLARLETNLFWYENPGWERHTLSRTSDLRLGVGSSLGDLTGNGRLDLVIGQARQHSAVYWFEQPADPREPWERHLLTERFQKYHDLTIADVDDDGSLEVVGLSQEAGTVFYFDVPESPRVEPWPAAHCHVVDDERRVEGLAVVDIDGDGRTEIVAGTNLYHSAGDGVGAERQWTRRSYATGWDDVRVAVADLDDDGTLEIVVAEGDSPAYGTHPARVAWFDPPDWDCHLLADDLFCPHSLQAADVTGNGCPDIYVGEMGLGEHETPRQLLFSNDHGQFTEHTLDTGVPTHEAKLIDVDGDGRLDIVGKSYAPDAHVDVWYNRPPGES